MKRIAYLFTALFCIVLSSCSNEEQKKDYLTVHFDTCIDLETNYIEDQLLDYDSLVKEPAVILPNDLSYSKKISGWYSDSSYNTKWDFKNDRVKSDMTLYAKWVDIIKLEYYLKGSYTPIWTIDNALSGEPLQRHDELCDGYQFYGYFEDSACTIPFDLKKPLEENTTVYLYRGDTLSLNPHSIKRRFEMRAAGGTGSTAGNISSVETDDNGEEYVDVNFGYSTSGDPYMLISNPQIDISNSQKIKMKFKNFGSATNLAFYWVSKYDDGSYASDYQFDSEANAAHYILSDNERNMSESDPWIEREFDLSEKISNGISPWGNSVTLVHLRIQFSYISQNINDLSNVVRFQSIEGIPNDEYKGFKDSEAIRELLKHDSDEALAEVSASQEQNRGVIFPKNNNLVSEKSTGYFKKKEGLLMYGPYGCDIRRYFFDVSEQNIDASEYSYISIKFRNYSYIPSFTFYVTTTAPGSGNSLNTVSSVSLPIRMKSKDEVSINFYGKTNMVGTITSFSILFNYNGVDNAILLESITLSENRSFQIPGFNFNDPKFAGFESNENVQLSYDSNASLTEFDVKANGASISYDLDYKFDTTPYKTLKVKYNLKQTGVTSFTIKIKIGGIYYSYSLDDLVISDDIREIEMELQSTGIIQSVSLEFEGIGVISIKEIEFVLDPETSCDFSDISTFSHMLSDWASPLSYVEDRRAVLYKNPKESFRYYFGYLYKYGNRDYPNISLKDKTKIYLIYQNQKSYGSPYLNVFAVNSNDNPEYLIAYNESSPIISGGTFVIDNNMKDNEWAVASINIPLMYSKENYYLSNIFFHSVEGNDISLYIRGIVIA